MQLSNKAVADRFSQERMVSSSCKSYVLQCVVEDLYLDKDFCRMYRCCGYRIGWRWKIKARIEMAFLRSRKVEEK